MRNKSGRKCDMGICVGECFEGHHAVISYQQVLGAFRTRNISLARHVRDKIYFVVFLQGTRGNQLYGRYNLKTGSVKG
jgi:hypothetical protein